MATFITGGKQAVLSASREGPAWGSRQGGAEGGLCQSRHAAIGGFLESSWVSGSAHCPSISFSVLASQVSGRPQPVATVGTRISIASKAVVK